MSAALFTVAESVAAAYGVGWNDIPRTLACKGVGLRNGIMRQAPQSGHLGTEYIKSFTPSFSRYDRTLHLSGGCGEAMTRDVYRWVDDSSDDVMYRRMAADMSGDIGGDTKAAECMTALLRRCMERLPESPT